MSNTYSPQEICDAANKIKDYCHGTKCEQCLFYAKKKRAHMLFDKLRISIGVAAFQGTTLDLR